MKARIATLVVAAAIVAACAAILSRKKASNGAVLEPAHTAGFGAGGASPKTTAHDVAAIPVETEDTEAGRPEERTADDLTAVKGIGDVFAARLADLGITTYAQVADWSDADIESIGPRIEVGPNRIRRDDWMGQARALLER